MSVSVDYEARRQELRRRYLTAPPQEHTTGVGVNHLALICSDIERTIDFYTQVLGFPLTELFQNRDLPSSTHFFFDIGNGNRLAFFDFPEHPMPPTRESIGGMHHIAISVEPDRFQGGSEPPTHATPIGPRAAAARSRTGRGRPARGRPRSAPT